MEERPAADVIIPIIQQFLSYCPHSPPLCDMPQSGLAALGADSSTLSRAPTEGSSTDDTQSSSDEEIGTGTYIVIIISDRSIILTPRHL
jgi:hypothetical protein